MNDLFIQFGVQAGGGPAFLRRERTAVGQLQTRTRTSYTYSQLQTRTRTCSCSSVTGPHSNDIYGVFESGSYQCYPRTYYNCSGQVVWSDCPGSCDPGDGGFNCQFNSSHVYVTCGPLTTFTYNECVTSETGFYYSGSCSSFDETWRCDSNYQLLARQCTNTTSTSCDWSGWSGYSNTGSCSTTYPGCSNGAVQRECRTVTLCAWNAYTAWSNTTSCTPATPTCPTSGTATERNCQTVYSWGNWTAYEEVDICNPQSPALGAGAVEVECVPQ